jgi:hypothetical protein
MSDWTRVSKTHPCPVCGRPDWCIFAGPADNPTAAICARVESGKRAGEAGWLHVLRDCGATWAPWRRTLRKAVDFIASQPAAAGIAAECAAGVRWAVDHPEPLERFAVGLGVSPESLRRLGVGYSPDRQAWLFPMTDAAGNICGVRLRLSSGRKLSIRGGKEGLFIPAGIDGGRLLITEGPTDCAALLDLGFCAVGRPSCSGGVAHLVGLVGRLKPGRVVLVADADGPGRAGAQALAERLRALCGDVRVIEPAPGQKDMRQWKAAGATRADVQSAIDAAPRLQLNVTSNIRTRKKGRTWKAATATA